MKHIGDGVHALVQGIFDEHALDGIIEDGHVTKVPENGLNDNFSRKNSRRSGITSITNGVILCILTAMS